MDRWTREFHTAFFREKERVIREAIAKAGFDPDDLAFIKEHCRWVTFSYDTFEHLYYHYGETDEIRIISTENQPNIDIGYDHVGGVVKDIQRCSISAKYY